MENLELEDYYRDKLDVDLYKLYLQKKRESELEIIDAEAKREAYIREMSSLRRLVRSKEISKYLDENFGIRPFLNNSRGADVNLNIYMCFDDGPSFMYLKNINIDRENPFQIFRYTKSGKVSKGYHFYGMNYLNIMINENLAPSDIKNPSKIKRRRGKTGDSNA